MKYIFLSTLSIGLLLSWICGNPSPDTYQGERLFYRMTLLVVTALSLFVEGIIWWVVK